MKNGERSRLLQLITGIASVASSALWSDEAGTLLCRGLRRTLVCGLRTLVCGLRTLVCGSSLFVQCPNASISHSAVCSDNQVPMLFQKFEYSKRWQVDCVVIGEALWKICIC